MFLLEDVAKTYTRRGQKIVAFQSERLEIPDGAYLALVGPSGCGKTTLLSMLGAMLSPTTGRITLDGESLYDLSTVQRTRLRREKIGFVFQTFNLIPYLSALENVQVPMCLAGLPVVQQHQRARDLLASVGLADRIEHKPCELSTGQQQRVALARTLANDPQVILADEPTGNLDPESRATVLDFFDDFHRAGRTIVMVTHDAAAADRAQSILRLHSGRIVSADALRLLKSA